jgi:hypothetical protein
MVMRRQRVFGANQILPGNVNGRRGGGFRIAPVCAVKAVRVAVRTADRLAAGQAPPSIPTEQESPMMRKTIVLSALLGFAGMALADMPLMNMVADKVIQKYQSSTCEQLWAQKQQPKSEQEQRLIGLLKNDAQLRTAFLNKVSGPIANKMFECGMIP